MSVFKRLLCILLALVILVNIPGMVPKADAVAAGVIAGTVAIGATAVIGALLTNLGFKAGSNSAAWNDLVSRLETHFSALGYIVDGMINVAKFKPTDDAEEFKAAIAQDIAGLTAQWLSDENVVADNISPTLLDSSSFSFGDLAFSLSSKSPIYFAPYQIYSSYYKEYDLGIAFFSSDVIGGSYSGSYSNSNFYSSSKTGDFYFCATALCGTSKSRYGYPLLASNSNTDIAAYVSSLASSIDGDSTGIDVSTVPANFTDIAAAYPDWVSTGVQEKDKIYLPLPLIITEPIVTPTESTEATEAPEPTTEPTDPTTPLLPDDPNGPVSNTGLQLALGALLTGIGAYFGDLISDVSGGLERLGDRVANLFDGFLPTLELIKDKLTYGFIDLKTWFDDLLETLHKFFTETFPNWMQEVGTWLGSFFANLEALFISVFTKLFVPSPGYWDAKITACRASFPFFDSMLTSFDALRGFLLGLGSRPPIIYIDLSNKSWAMGGRIAFIDLTWYAEYKTTMDYVLSAFLWLLFLWRVFLNLPSILEGLPGISVFFPTSAERLDAPALPPVGMPPAPDQTLLPDNDRKRLP